MLNATVFSNNESMTRIVNSSLLVSDIETVTNKYLLEQEVPPDLNKSILNCDFVVVVDEYNETNTILAPLLALLSSKPTIVIANNSSLFSDIFSLDNVYFISLEREAYQLPVRIFETVNTIKAGLEISTQPIYVQHSPREEIENEYYSEDQKEGFRLIRVDFNHFRYEEAREKASTLYETHPKLWRALIAKSAALVYLHLIQDAEEAVNEVINKFAGDRRALSYAYQNKAWIRHTNLNYPSEEEEQVIIQYFHKSISYEPRLILFINLIVFLILHNKIEEAESEWHNCLTYFPFAYAKYQLYERIRDASADFKSKIIKSRFLSSILLPKKN